MIWFNSMCDVKNSSCWKTDRKIMKNGIAVSSETQLCQDSGNIWLHCTSESLLGLKPLGPNSMMLFKGHDGGKAYD